MKIQVTFKTPDALFDAAQEYAFEKAESSVTIAYNEAFQEAREKLSKFIRYEENITIEFDIEAGTAVVVPVK